MDRNSVATEDEIRNSIKVMEFRIKMLKSLLDIVNEHCNKLSERVAKLESRV